MMNHCDFLQIEKFKINQGCTDPEYNIVLSAQIIT